VNHAHPTGEIKSSDFIEQGAESSVISACERRIRHLAFFARSRTMSIKQYSTIMQNTYVKLKALDLSRPDQRRALRALRLADAITDMLGTLEPRKTRTQQTAGEIPISRLHHQS
jgi:hypothetical protein